MFSIIIPAYNEAKYIEKTLGNLPKDVDVIVVCNGCTDNTFKLAKKYTKKVYSIKQKNVSLARNYGARHASNKNLIFLDADTILKKETFNNISKIFHNDIIGTCKVKPNHTNIITLLFTKIKNFLPMFKFHNSSGIIFCGKDVFNKTHGFNVKLTKSENGDFVNRAKKHGEFAFTKGYVTTSMRRFEKYGYLKTILFWILYRLNLSDKPYPAIR